MDRPTEAIKKLLECISNETCEREGCEYWNHLGEIEEVRDYIEFLESELEFSRQHTNNEG